MIVEEKTKKGPVHHVKLEIVLSDAQYKLALQQVDLVRGGECSPQEWLQAVAQLAINDRIKVVEALCSPD